MKKWCIVIFILLLSFNFVLMADQEKPGKGRIIYGPWITESWGQSYPYNMFCPLNPNSNRECLVGLIPLSFALIINYHKNIDNVYFDDGDDYFSDPIYIDDDYLQYDFPSFSELNTYLDTIRYNYANELSLNYELISALNFACGIATQHQYVTGYTLLADSYVAFINKFNYQNATYTTTINNDFFLTLQSNMIDGNPAILGITGSSGSTLAICDGYNTSNNTYHMNFMLAGAYDGWYSLPDGLPMGFNTINCAVINIEPPALSVQEDHQDNFFAGNFPNPFRSSTTFSFSSKAPIQNAEIKVYNIKGQLVRELRFNASSLSRFNEISWDGKDEKGSDVAQGIYFYRCTIGNKNFTDKIIKLQ